MMNPFTRLPGSQKYVPGLEWKVLKRLPSVLAYGICALLLLHVFIQYGNLPLGAKAALTAQYAIVGAVIFHVMCVMIVALYCAIVWIMKGPAYVRDPYYLPEPQQSESDMHD